MSEEKKYCLSDEEIRIIVAKVWSEATGDEVSPYHVDIRPAQAVAHAESEAKENYLRHEKGWCTSLELQEAVQQAEYKVAEELYENIICPICYWLNPQHASMDHGTGCHSCQEKESYLKPAPTDHEETP